MWAGCFPGITAGKHSGSPRKGVRAKKGWVATGGGPREAELRQRPPDGLACSGGGARYTCRAATLYRGRSWWTGPGHTPKVWPFQWLALTASGAACRSRPESLVLGSAGLGGERPPDGGLHGWADADDEHRGFHSGLPPYRDALAVPIAIAENGGDHELRRNRIRRAGDSAP